MQSSVINNNEPLLSQMLKTTSESLRHMANLMDALALANAGGNDADLLRSSDVQKLLNCSQSKASQIIRAYGIGQGKMARVERGVLIQQLKEGKL